MKVFISGQVSGRDYGDAFTDFALAEYALYMSGYKTCNPLRICKSHWYWWLCMIVCLFNLIFFCNGICQLPGWEHSRGAKIEARVAKFFNYKKIIIK